VREQLLIPHLQDLRHLAEFSQEIPVHGLYSGVRGVEQTSAPVVDQLQTMMDGEDAGIREAGVGR